MIELESRRDTLDVVDDQRGQPTWSADLAARIADLGPRLGRDESAHGVFHGTQLRRGHLVRTGPRGLPPARRRPGAGAPTTPARRSSRPAPRPAYSALGHDRWSQVGLEPLRDWREALREALPLIRKEMSA